MRYVLIPKGLSLSELEAEVKKILGENYLRVIRQVIG